MHRITALVAATVACVPLLVQADSPKTPSHPCTGPACVPGASPFGPQEDFFANAVNPFYNERDRAKESRRSKDSVFRHMPAGWPGDLDVANQVNDAQRK